MKNNWLQGVIWRLQDNLSNEMYIKDHVLIYPCGGRSIIIDDSFSESTVRFTVEMSVASDKNKFGANHFVNGKQEFENAFKKRYEQYNATIKIDFYEVAFTNRIKKGTSQGSLLPRWPKITKGFGKFKIFRIHGKITIDNVSVQAKGSPVYCNKCNGTGYEAFQVADEVSTNGFGRRNLAIASFETVVKKLHEFSRNN